MLTCCVTGHRDIPPERLAYVRAELRRVVEQAIADGYTCFLSGLADGADLLFLEVVAEARHQHPQIRMEGALPYRGRMDRLNAQPKARALLSLCNVLHVLSEAYDPGVFQRRNRYLIARSQRVIAVYDGRNGGGTAYTLHRAQKLGREVCIIKM